MAAGLTPILLGILAALGFVAHPKYQQLQKEWGWDPEYTLRKRQRMAAEKEAVAAKRAKSTLAAREKLRKPRASIVGGPSAEVMDAIANLILLQGQGPTDYGQAGAGMGGGAERDITTALAALGMRDTSQAEMMRAARQARPTPVPLVDMAEALGGVA